jgi:hypothetical protein
VRKVLGGARITISIRCSDPSEAHVSGLIRQRRNQLVDGFFNKSADCSTRWTEVKANATSYGRPFKVGKAVVRTDVFVTAGERSGEVRSRRVVDLK